MKNLLKVAFGIIAYSQLNRDFGNVRPTTKTGFRTNMPKSQKKAAGIRKRTKR